MVWTPAIVPIATAAPAAPLPPPSRAPAMTPARAAALSFCDFSIMALMCRALAWAISWAITLASSLSFSARVMRPRKM